MRQQRFIDRSGAPQREELVRRLEDTHSEVPVCELRLALRRESLRRELRKLEKRLEEEGL